MDRTERTAVILTAFLAGHSRGLSAPGGVERRAEEVLAALQAEPRQRLVPSVRILQVVAWLAVRGESAPPMVLEALAALLGVRRYALRASGGGSARSQRRWRANARPKAPKPKEALYDAAIAAPSAPLVLALAVELGVADRNGRLTQGAVETLTGHRAPEQFLAATASTASQRARALALGVDRRIVREWERTEAGKLNRAAAAYWSGGQYYQDRSQLPSP